jgi:hypothetical protein
MPNSIALAEKYLAVTDLVYKNESKTVDLDFANSEINFIGANKAEVFKLSMDGLGDYSRNSGYPKGSVTGTWEALTLTKDRGVQLGVDRYDDEETLNQAFGRLASEFERTEVIPEVDAYCFSKLFAGTGNTVATAAITVGTTDVPGLVDSGSLALDDAEVPREGRILYVSPLAYAGLKARITRTLHNEREAVKAIEMYDDMKVVVVPSARFVSAITLNSGATNFGYAPTSGGYKINFMIVHPSAVKKAVKHNMPKIFTPDQNQSSDQYLLDWRLYYDVFVLDNKNKGIFVNRDTTAIS